MQPLRYVVLGAGGIANHHVESLKPLPAVQPVGFQDIVEPTLQKWKERFAEAEVDTDPARLLARTRPDLVCVCSSNVAHEALARAAFQAGCHVMCEKPMAMNVPEALAMDEQRSKAGKLGAINFSYRCVPAFRFAREMIRAGELGTLQRLNVVYLQSFLGAEASKFSWRNDIAIAGFGALGDLGVHMIDGAGFVSGLVPRRAVGLAQTLVAQKKDAQGKPQPVTTDTNASFLIEYDNGAIGTFETSQVVPGYGNHFRIEISGDRGILSICSEEGGAMTLYAGTTLSKYGTWTPRSRFPQVAVPSTFSDSQPKSNLESFVRAIRGEDIEYASFADGLRAQKVLGAIVDSMKSNAWVKT